MSTTRQVSNRSILVEAAQGARLAPSVHNTQPWTFVVTDEHLDLLADERRQLRVLDPLGRELAIGCGSALFNIRVVLAAWGYDAIVERTPDPTRPELLARVTVGRVLDEPSPLGCLEPILALRHTNRRKFASGGAPKDLIVAIEKAVRAEGVELVAITNPDDRLAVARLAQQADRIQNADAGYRAELRTWMASNSGRLDGVPVEAIPHVDGTATDDVPIRDFDTHGAGQLPPDTHSDRDQCLVLLCSSGDTVLDWIRIGEALEHAWLELTRLGFAASPLTQMTEVPYVCVSLRRELRLDMYPQLLLRIGQAAPTVPTPRRAADDVIQMAP